MSKNTNCLEDIRCPECGYEDDFLINVTVKAFDVRVTDDGYDIFDSPFRHDEWDDEIKCGECDHEGTLEEFRVKENSNA